MTSHRIRLKPKGGLTIDLPVNSLASFPVFLVGMVLYQAEKRYEVTEIETHTEVVAGIMYINMFWYIAKEI